MIRINFFLSKTRINQNGECPLAISLAKNGIRISSYIGLRCPTKHWDTKKKRAKKEYEFINPEIDRICQKIREIEKNFILCGEEYSPKTIWKEFKGDTKTRLKYERPVLEVIKEHLSMKLDKGIITKRDRNTHKTVVMKIEYFLKSKGMEHIGFNKFDYNLFEEMVATLKQTRFNRLEPYLSINNPVGNAHLKRIIQTVRSANKYALKKGYTKTTAPEMESLKYDAKSTVFLTIWELEALKNFDTSKDKILDAVKDVFLFSCYTGFLWSDMLAFEPENHLEIDEKGNTWILKPREKTGTEQHLPLFPEAKEILEKWENKLPLGSEVVHNRIIKTLARCVGITKLLTNRCGRKTAGMFWLNKGVSTEVVANMLGHKDIRITQRHYAQIQRERIARETEHLMQSTQNPQETPQIQNTPQGNILDLLAEAVAQKLKTA